jgi:hypothetical protein
MTTGTTNTCNPLMSAGTAQSEWQLGYGSTIKQSVFDSRHGQEIYLFSTASRPTLSQSNGYQKYFRRRNSGRDVKLTTHHHILPKLRRHIALTPFPHMSP